jgi:hypothetical protein
MRDTLVLNGAIFSLQYNVLKDFEPVALISNSRGALFVVKKVMPSNDLRRVSSHARRTRTRQSINSHNRSRL